MADAACPFCNPAAGRLFFESELVLGIWDAFPVADGHALLVTRRHVATWFDATADERHALTAAIDMARQATLARHKPDGFNIGINVGEAAGQTVPHLHLHVIPRYAGDVADPRGGVRHVIPGRANYLAGETSTAPARNLITGGDDPLLPHIVAHLATADRADIVVSFALESGVHRVFEHFRDLLARGGRLRILTGDYLGITEPNALMRLLDLEGNVERRVFETGATQGSTPAPPVRSFHPKAYIFRRVDTGSAFVGSSNLSASALTTAVEWNYRVVSSADGSRSRNCSPTRTPGCSTLRGSSAIASAAPSSAPSSKPRMSTGRLRRRPWSRTLCSRRPCERWRTLGPPATKRAWSSWRQGSARPGSRRSTRAGRSSAACCSRRTGKRF